MNLPTIEIFDYEEEIKMLPEEWMVDLAVVFREMDEDLDGIVPTDCAKHILRIFSLYSDEAFANAGESVRLSYFLEEAREAREIIFSNPLATFSYYFDMMTGVSNDQLSALDLQRFFAIFGDKIQLKYCDDFIDEFDRELLSKDYISKKEFIKFCADKKIPALP